MLKFFSKLLFLFFIVLTLSIIIRHFIYEPMHLLPYSYSANEIHLKRTYLNKHKRKFNTVFIGSSHVFRQFDGHLFDSLARDVPNLSSFNFGIQGLAASELFYLNDNLLEDYKKDSFLKGNLPLKYLLIEISKITFPDHLNLNTTRMFYWYDWPYYTFTIKAIFDSKNNTFPLKIAMAGMHTAGLLDKQLNFNYLTDFSAFKLREEYVNTINSSINNSYNGYEPRIKTMKKLMLDSTALLLRKNGSAEQFHKYENNPELLKKYNKVYLAKINETIQKFSKKGIHTIFVFAPRAEKQQYDEIIPLLNKIDPKNKIEIADSRKYPELYYVDNSADETHLNSKGAEIFTRLLAHKFLEITNPKTR
jgi:hypothetical protein